MIEFDKPVKISYLYSRVPDSSKKDKETTTSENDSKNSKNTKNKKNKKENDLSETLYIKGFRDGKQVFNLNYRVFTGRWTKITPKQAIIDSLWLPREFLYDDISIIYDSDFDNNSIQQEIGLSEMLDKVIEEIMEKKGND